MNVAAVGEDVNRDGYQAKQDAAEDRMAAEDEANDAADAETAKEVSLAGCSWIPLLGIGCDTYDAQRTYEEDGLLSWQMLAAAAGFIPGGDIFKTPGQGERVSDAAKSTANAVGLAREERVADIVGGSVAKDADGQDIPLVVPGVGRTGLDVLGPNGEYVFVGAPKKASDPARFGCALQIAKAAADQAGVRAMYYLEEGTPQSAIDQATKRFGADNVFLFPRGS